MADSTHHGNLDGFEPPQKGKIAEWVAKRREELGALSLNKLKAEGMPNDKEPTVLANAETTLQPGGKPTLPTPTA